MPLHPTTYNEGEMGNWGRDLHDLRRSILGGELTDPQKIAEEFRYLSAKVRDFFPKSQRDLYAKALIETVDECVDQRRFTFPPDVRDVYIALSDDTKHSVDLSRLLRGSVHQHVLQEKLTDQNSLTWIFCHFAKNAQFLPWKKQLSALMDCYDKTGEYIARGILTDPREIRGTFRVFSTDVRAFSSREVRYYGQRLLENTFRAAMFADDVDSIFRDNASRPVPRGTKPFFGR